MYPVTVLGIAATCVTALYFLRKYFAGGTCKCTERMNGKTFIVTGASAGIGKETARILAEKGARVILASRNLAKTTECANSIRHETGNENVIAMQLDLASFSSVRNFVKEFLNNESKLDVLINNAGVFYVPRSITEDNHEIVFQSNYLGHFLLTMLLLDILKRSPSGRIVNVSSIAYGSCKAIDFDDLKNEKKYHKFSVYAQSKLAQILFTRTLAKKLNGTNVTVNALHPGCIITDIQNHYPLLSNRFLRTIQWPLFKLFFKTVREGAQTTIHCAVSSECQYVTGCYFKDCAVYPVYDHAKDGHMAERLWEESLKLVNLKECL